MIHYRLSYKNPQHRFLAVEVKIPVLSDKKIQVQLPSWRPGRYELGNFAKNIRNFQVKNEKGNAVPFSKLNKDLWEIIAKGETEITVSYHYYAADLNAGSTYIDEKQLYVNPVNCCIYVPSRIDESSQFTVEVPAGWEMACGMKHAKTNGDACSVFHMQPGSFHELADSPFIVSPQFHHREYRVDQTLFHIWFNGECRPDWDRILNDFSAFTKKQIQAYGAFPVDEYHFLIQILPVQFYHGVEHQTSSVNALGPGYELMRDRYDDLLGLCSHELYHAWNIKSIRPAEMWPYRYQEENYFKTGYVAEGVTTYMGDYFLLASGVFSVSNYLSELSAQLQKHLDNFGRKNYSVADSSWDTWLDGYVPGVPERKVSIYTEGCLLAFMTDVLIMKHSKNKFRLHDVMKKLYTEYYLKGKGYTASDYRAEVESFAGTGLCEFFDTLVNGKQDYIPTLQKCLEYVGLEISSLDPATAAEKFYGIKITDAASGSVITAIHPDEPAYHCGISLGDKLISINGYQVNSDANKWIAYFAGETLDFICMRNSELKKIQIPTAENSGFRSWKVTRLEKISGEQQKNFNLWSTLTN